MTPDILNLTAAGEQALLNADAGGLFVAPKYFKIGDLEVPDVAAWYAAQGSIPEGLVSNQIYSGTISYVQVRSTNTVVFTLDLPEGFPIDSNPNDGTAATVPIGELVIQLEDGTALGHCVYAQAYTKRSNEALRLEVMLHVEAGNATAIDVTLSELSSIPTVVSVDSLPSPVEAIANAIGVQDLSNNADGSSTPGLVQKFGPGWTHWSFSGYTRVFNGDLGAGATSNESAFQQPVLYTYEGLAAGDVVIVQVIGGAGAGETRKFEVFDSGSGIRFQAVGSGFSSLDDDSAISIWKSQSGGLSTPWPPGPSDVPSNYVLERGVTSPRWVPPLKPSGNGTTLYHPPGELSMVAYVIAADDSSGQRTFELYQKNLSQATNEKAQIHKYSHTQNSNYSYIALGGVTQHREAFELTENSIEFSEDLPVDTQIDARLFSLNASTGAYLNIRYAEYTGDGSNKEFDIPVMPGETIVSPDQCLVYVDPFLQSINSYVIDTDNQKIVFTSAPSQGLKVEVNAFVTNAVVGYATHIHTVNYTTKDLTRILQLPFAPSDKGLVFISEQGMHVNRSLFDIVDDRVIFRRDIDADRDLEVMIFRNVLSEGSGDNSISSVVTDAVVTSKSIELIRHNADRIRLPVPKINVAGGDGIRVEGTYPEFTIHSTLSETIAADNPTTFNNQHRLVDAEELIYTTRVSFKGDIRVRATADFNARLGPGFSSDSGLENVEFVLGYKTHSRNEPEYGRNIRGTGSTGFSVTDPSRQGTYAYSDKSVTQSWNIQKANNLSGYIDVVAKMRVKNGRVSDYGSVLTVNLVVDVEPILS